MRVLFSAVLLNAVGLSGLLQAGGPPPGANDRAQLIEGVREVTAPGSPWALAEYAPTASPIVTATSDRGSEVSVITWTRMPSLANQARLDDAYTADFTVVRTLLQKGEGYEDAVDAYRPYDRIREVVDDAREGMANIAGWARPMKSAFLFVKKPA
jgi:hypothetical protein